MCTATLCHLRAASRVLLVWTSLVALFVHTADAQWTKICDTLGVQTDNGGGSLVEAEGYLFWGHGWDGVFRSTDGGATWEAVNNGIMLTDRVSCLAIVRASDGTPCLIAGTLASTIYRSVNDGDNWTKVYNGPNNGYSSEITSLGVAGSTVLAGVFFDPYGVISSVDAGATWNGYSAGIPDDSNNVTPHTHTVWSLAGITVGGTNYFYAGTNTGVCVSTTNGVSWAPISSNLPSNPVRAIAAAHPATSNLLVTVFAGVWEKGMFTSTNEGASWTAAGNGFYYTGNSNGPALYIDAIQSLPGPSGTTPSIFALAFPSVFVSTDMGEEWMETGLQDASGTNAYGSLCVTGGYVFAETYDMALWRYTAGSDSSWVMQLGGTTETLRCVKAVDNTIVWTGGTHGTVLRTTDAGTTWASAGGGTIGSDTVHCIEALDGLTAMVASYAGSGGRILRTNNGGSSWSAAYAASGVAFGGIQMKSALEGYAVGSSSGGKWTVLKTTNGGSSWDVVSTAPNVDSLTGLVQQYYGPVMARPIGVQYHDGILSFGGPGGTIFSSTNGGATWITSAVGGQEFFLGALHFNSSALALAGSGFSNSYGGKTRATTNGGASWESAGTIASSIVTDIGGIGSEFWGTIGGSIAYTKSNGTSWSYSTPGHWGLKKLNAISFSPAVAQVNGWAVGESGMILHYHRTNATAVAQQAVVPSDFRLEQNYPNPFNPSTTIRYGLPNRSHVTLAVFNTLGQQVALLQNGEQEAGYHEAKFDGRNLSSGVYFYRLQAGTFVETKRLLLLR